MSHSCEPAATPPLSRTSATRTLTEVELFWCEGRVERWIRFGRPVEERVLDRRRRVFAFPPGALFAFVRWMSNDFGTVVSRIDILRAVAADEPLSSIPNVRPGGEILLRQHGWPKVRATLEVIDAVEAAGIRAEDVAPDYWRHVHNRLSVGERPRRYTAERHHAWLLRLRVTS